VSGLRQDGWTRTVFPGAGRIAAVGPGKLSENVANGDLQLSINSTVYQLPGEQVPLKSAFQTFTRNLSCVRD
jgi:hypothetical protein